MGQHTTQLNTLAGGIVTQRAFPFMAPSEPALLIGLVGRRQSGKDTVASVARELDDSVIRLGFGDPVKAEVAEALEVTLEYLDAHKEQLRPLVQAWGTEWRRNLCAEDYWLRRMSERIAAAPEDSIVIITDVRFENEADYIRGRGGVVVALDVDNSFKRDDPVDQHPSETGSDTIKADYRIWNDQRTRAQLQIEVDEMLKWASEQKQEATPPQSAALAN